MSAPTSVLAVALSALASGLWAVGTTSLGLPFFEFDGYALPWSLCLVLGVVQIGAGFGMLRGDNASRIVYLWILGLGFFASWWALHGYVQDGAGFSAIAGSVSKAFVCCWFAWYLSGPKAMPFFVPAADQGHGDGHGDHGPSHA